MRTIAISNYKGGVGKTTSAVNLASIYADAGRRVLLIDLDPQASVADLAFETETENLSVIPSTIELVDQNELLLREQRLKFALDDAADTYDIAIIDCSPVLKRLAFNAYLAAADGGIVVVPVKLDSTVMRGTALTVEATKSIAEALRMPCPKYRILRTCVPGRMTKAERTGAEVLDRFFPDTQFQSVIHASAKVCEGSWQWTPVASFEPGSRPARDYAALAEEVLNELG